MELKKFTFAAMLAAISVVIDVIVKQLIGTNTIGTAYYAIPIIIAAIFLGVKYSLVIAILADAVSVLLAGQTFLPLFMVGPIIWGLIPGLLLKKNSNLFKIIVVLLITHLLVTTANSIALVIHIHKSWQALLVDLPLRAGLIIPNTLIIAFLTEAVREPMMLRKSFLNSDL